jgi:DNA-binding NtrC family response regulator
MAAARQLGISKNALYRLIEQSPTLRKGSDFPREEVLAALARCGDNLEQAAAELQISERALRIRMTDLGLS